MEKSANHFWSNLQICKLNRSFVTICNGLNKLHRLFFAKDLGALRRFDLLLLYSFFITFVGFLIAISFCLLEPESLVVNFFRSQYKYLPNIFNNWTATMKTKIKKFCKLRTNSKNRKPCSKIPVSLKANINNCVKSELSLCKIVDAAVESEENRSQRNKLKRSVSFHTSSELSMQKSNTSFKQKAEMGENVSGKKFDFKRVKN